VVALLLVTAKVFLVLTVAAVVLGATLQTHGEEPGLLVKAIQAETAPQVVMEPGVAAVQVALVIPLLIQKTGPRLVEMGVLELRLTQLFCLLLAKVKMLAERIILRVVVEVAVIKVRFLRVNLLVDMAAAEMLVQTLLLQPPGWLILVVAVAGQDLSVVPFLAAVA